MSEKEEQKGAPQVKQEDGPSPVTNASVSASGGASGGASTRSKPTAAASAGTKSGGGWSSYLKKAVANVEASLDKILDEPQTENAAAATGTTTAQPARRTTTSPTPRTASPASPASTSGRVSMQERIAQAMGSGGNSTEGSPRQSVDTSARGDEKSAIVEEAKAEREPQGDTTKDETKDVTKDATKGATQDTVETAAKPDTEEHDPVLVTVQDIAKEGFEGTSLDACAQLTTKLAESGLSPEQQKLVAELAAEISSQQDKLKVENELMANRVDSLESKLKVLARSEAERARTAQKGKSGLEKSLAAKDEQIAQLFEEGQMLAKKELTHMNTIKRLRAKERDFDKSTEGLRRRCDKAEAEVAALQEKLRKASAIEKAQSDTIRDMSKAQKELEKLQRENADMADKLASLGREHADMKKQYEEKAFEAQEASLAEAQSRVSELETQLSKRGAEVSELQERLKQEREALEHELEAEIKSASRKETELRDEVKDLEARVEHYRALSEAARATSSSDGGSKEASESALVQQVEVLQAQHAIASENWAGIETRLRDRVAEMERELESAKTQEISLRKKYKDLSLGSRSLAAEKEQLADELSALQSDLERARTEARSAKSALTEAETAQRARLDELTKRISSLESDKAALTEELESVRARLDEAERINAELDATPPSLPPPADFEPESEFVAAASSPVLGYTSRFDRHRSVSRGTPMMEQGSAFGSAFGNTFGNADTSMASSELPTAEISRVTSPTPGNTSRDYSSSATGAPATSMQLVGKMNMTIRLLESELAQTRADLDKAKKEKEAVYQEVAGLFRTNEKLHKYEAEATELRAQVEDLKAREQTALEMLGEKSERVNELQADVQDLKDMYRQQIEQLADQLQAATAR